MNSEQTKVAKNTSWFTLALVLQKVIAFVYFTILARQLGATALGQYVFALSFIAVFSIVIDFGTNHFITREVAKDKNQSQKIYSNILGFKLFSGILAILLAIIFINLLHYPVLTKQLVYIAVVLMLIESLVLSSYSLIRGHHNLFFESIGTIGVQILVAIAGILVLQFTKDLRILMTVLLGANFLNLIYVTFLLVIKLNLKVKLSFDIIYWKSLFKIILPFALAAGFTKIYGSFDQVLLSKLASDEALGYYAVAYKLTFALQFLPLALVASLYPAMSTYFHQDKQMLNKSFTRAVYYLIVLTIPISAGVIVLAPQFIISLYGKTYINSVLALQILISSLIFLFLNFPLGSLLNAANKQIRQTLNISLAMILNIVLNILFIPKWQEIGAALASASSTLFLFVIGVQAIRGIVKVDYLYLLKTGSKTIIAGIVMMAVIYTTRDLFFWPLAGFLGLIIYLAWQFVWHTINIRDIKQFYQSFSKK